MKDLKRKVWFRLAAMMITAIMLTSSLNIAVFAADDFDAPYFEDETEITTDTPEDAASEDVPEDYYISIPESTDEDFADNKVLVTFKKEYSDPEVEVTPEDFPELNIEGIKNFIISDPNENFKRDIAIILAEHDKEGVISACELISKREDVLRVTPSYIMHITDCAIKPNDLDYSQSETAFNLIAAPTVWENITTGSKDVKVAVIDTKVDKHRDFEDNLIEGHDGVNHDGVTNEKEYSDHGTRVASVIGAKGNNGLYSTGVCWNVSIAPMQFYKYSSDGTYNADYEALEEDFHYMKSEGIYIANCSFGGYGDIIVHNWWKYTVEEWGGILVAAAGNDNKNTDIEPHYPSCVESDNIISVAAYNDNGKALASFSNYGKESVDLVAPGTNIYVLTGSDGSDKNNGTSLAAPFVTGAAALLKSEYRDATSEEIIKALKLGANEKDWMTEKVKYGGLNIEQSFKELEKIIEDRKTVESGTYVLGVPSNSFRVLDTASGIRINESNGSDYQKYEIIYHTTTDSRNYYTIKSVSTGKYFAASGTSIVQNNWSGADEQKWKIESVSGDIYRIINQKSGLAMDFEANGQKVTLKAVSNKDTQNFRFIASGKKVNIEDGLYTIKCKEGSDLYLNVSGTSVRLNSSKSYFKVINKDGYSYITKFEGNKALGLDSGGALKAVQESETDAQKWYIKDGGDGCAYIVSYDGGSVIGGKNGSVSSTVNAVMEAAVGSDAQRFYFEKIDKDSGIFADNDSIAIGYCYLTTGDGSSGINMETGTLYDVETGVLHDLNFVLREYGLCTIELVGDGRVLEVKDDGTVGFSEYEGSEMQLWKISVDSKDGITHSITNIYAEKDLKYTVNEDGSINLVMATALDRFPRPISFTIKRRENIQVGVDYLIVPKNEPGKAVTINAETATNNMPLTLKDIDFNNVGQKYNFSLEDGYSYTISSTKFDGYGIGSYNVYNTVRTGLSSTKTSIYVVQTADGCYKFMKNDSGDSITYKGGNSLTWQQTKAVNDDSQKFMLIPVTEDIEAATYQIITGDETEALSVSGSIGAGSAVTSEPKDESDISQLFYAYEDGNGSYRFISMYSGMALSLSDDLRTLGQSASDAGDDLQKWQIVNASEDSDVYTAQICSYRTGDYIRYDEDGTYSMYFDGRESQVSTTYTLKKVSSRVISALGEAVSAFDRSMDIYTDGNNAVLSNIATNGRSTLMLSRDSFGLWTVSERESGKVLEDNGEKVVFSVNALKDSQKWIITNVDENSEVIINLATGRVLKNEDGVLSMGAYTDTDEDKFCFFIKGDVNRDGDITTQDILLIRQYLVSIVELDEIEIYCGDFDCNGILNTADILLLRQYLVGIYEIAAIPYSVLTVSGNNDVDDSDISLDELLRMSDEDFLRLLFGNENYEDFSFSIFN